MVTVSFDPEAGTLYWYFTEIEAGSTELEGECNGTLLLDARGDVIGLELELDESVRPADLALALAHPNVRYDRAAATLTVLLIDEEPGGVQPLHEAVILDFDAGEHLQGCDVLASREFELALRLSRLQPFMVELEDEPPPAFGLDEEGLADEELDGEAEGDAIDLDAAELDDSVFLEDDTAPDDDDLEDETDTLADTAPDDDDLEDETDALADTAPDDDDLEDETDALADTAPDDDDFEDDAQDELLAAAAIEDGELDAEDLADAAALDAGQQDMAGDELADLVTQALDGPGGEGDLAAVVAQALAEADSGHDHPAAATGFRAGFVALVGKPNVGKSTLLNAMLGQKVAIVSPKPQTTRMPMRGILNRPDAQIIFVDTPGIHDPRTKLGTFMVEQARRSIPDADVVCFVVDIATPPNRIEQRIAALVGRSRARRILVLNKLDQRTRAGQENLAAYRALGPWDMEVAVSALLSKGLETLLDEIVARLPASPALYPTDQITDQTEREHAAELVREQVLRLTEQEVPHGVAVEVEEWEEKENAVYIRMTIYVEKESQKGILIGAQGAMLKKIGSGARPGIEALIGRRAYLDLWVKARPNWRDDPSSLHWLGYRSDD